jgi:DNA-directed RNA polymerase specialized sigma24 family protein
MSGYDEALDVVLDSIEKGCVPSPRTVKNLCANRAAKNRHRHRLASRLPTTEEGAEVVNAIDAKRLMVFAFALLGAENFNLLLDVAACSYEEVAAAHGVPLGTLKARVSRLRAQVRAAWADRGVPDFDAEAA